MNKDPGDGGQQREQLAMAGMIGVAGKDLSDRDTCKTVGSWEFHTGSFSMILQPRINQADYCIHATRP